MPCESGLSKKINEGLIDSEKTRIVYHYNDGILEINGEGYEVGRLSFTHIGNAVKEGIKELYGEYETIPYTFNSEAYENELVRAEVLALGGLGLLEFTVYKKEVVE